MTAAVLPLTPRPRFRNVVEALAWFARSNETASSKAPPVDATSDEYTDAYLATVFAALRHFDVPTRIAHLHEKAGLEDRQCMRVLSTAGEPGDTDYERHLAEAKVHEALALTLRKWATEIHEAAMDSVAGGAA